MEKLKDVFFLGQLILSRCDDEENYFAVINTALGGSIGVTNFDPKKSVEELKKIEEKEKENKEMGYPENGYTPAVDALIDRVIEIHSKYEGHEKGIQ